MQKIKNNRKCLQYKSPILNTNLKKMFFDIAAWAIMIKLLFFDCT